MAYPAPHKLLAFGGPLFSTEQWSCSIRFEDSGAGGNDADAAELDLIYPVMAAWWQSGFTVSGAAKLEWVKWNRIGTDGRYTQSVTNLHEWNPLLSTQGAAAQAPAQVALVATLETAAQRGLAVRGRIFLPCPGFTLGSDGRIQAAQATQAATWVANLLDNLNAVAGVGPAIVASDVREGAARPIVGVSVGRTLDTMRSRRTSISEERPASVPVAGP